MRTTLIFTIVFIVCFSSLSFSQSQWRTQERQKSQLQQAVSDSQQAGARVRNNSKANLAQTRERNEQTRAKNAVILQEGKDEADKIRQRADRVSRQTMEIHNAEVERFAESFNNLMDNIETNRQPWGASDSLTPPSLEQSAANTTDVPASFNVEQEEITHTSGTQAASCGPPETNGCGPKGILGWLVPDLFFGAQCAIHDLCYAGYDKYASWTREQCDEQLANDAALVGGNAGERFGGRVGRNIGEAIGSLYGKATGLFGKSFFDKAREEERIRQEKCK